MNLFQIHINAIMTNSLNSTSDSSPLTFILFFLSPAILFLLFYFYLNNKKGNGFSGESIDFNIILLAGIIIKGDNKVSEAELKKIKLYLEKNLSNRKSKKHFLKVKESIKTEIDLNEIIKKTNYNVVISNKRKADAHSKRNKVKWMHFLISVAVADRVLTKNELRILEQIRKGWELPLKTFNSILAMFNYYTEEDLNKQQRVKTYTSNNIKKYFLMLEIEETATDEEIKASYRKLVKQYHPDKNIDSDTLEQKLAKQKFQAIQEAYEKIKQERRF